MIKHLRQYRLPSYQEVMEEDKGTATRLPSFDEVMSQAPTPKKKETSSPRLYEMLSGSSLPSKYRSIGQTGQLPLQEKQKLTDYIYNLKTPEEKGQSKNTAENNSQLAYNQGQKKLEEIISVQGSKDPLTTAQNNMTESPDTQEGLKNYMAVRFLEDRVDGVDAKNILTNTHFGQEGDDNATTMLLVRKGMKYDETVKDLRKINLVSAWDNKEVDLENAGKEFLDYEFTPQLKRAAIRYGAMKDPLFAKELQTIGVDLNDPDLDNKIGSFKTGQWMAQYINDPDVQAYLQKENPKLIPAFQRVSERILVDNKEYGINAVANKVSKARQNEWLNDPIINFYGDAAKDATNAVAEKFLTPQELEIYDKEIRNNQEQYIDAPSLLEGFATAGKNFGKGIINTFTEPFTSASQTQKDVWDKEAQNISADPKGVAGFLRDTGSTLGLVASIGATGGVLGSTSAAIGVGFFGDMLEAGKTKFPDSPVKAYTSALVNTGLYIAMGKTILPANKVKAAFESVQPKVFNIVESLANGTITREAARRNINTAVTKAIDFVGGTLSKNAKITIDLTVIGEADKYLDKVMGMGDEEFKKFHPEGALVDNAEHIFMSNIVLAGLGKFGEMKKGNKLVEESIWQAVNNPKSTQRAIDNSSVDKSFGNVNEIKENFNYLVKVKGELDQLKINPKDQKRFLFESIREKVAKDEAERTTDPTIDQKNKDIIKDAKEIKEKILAGEDAESIVTEREQKVIDEKEKTDTEIERLTKANELDNKEFDAKRKELDGRVPDDRIKIERLEQGIKEKNEDFEKKVSKLKPKEEEQPEVSKTKPAIILPSENKVAENIPLIKTEKDALPIKEPEALPVDEAPGSRPEMEQGIPESKEPPPAQEKGKAAGEEEAVRLTHADTEQIYKEAGLPERLETPTKHREQLEKEANEQLEKGYDFDKVADKVMEGKYDWQDKDQFNFARKVADLKAKQKDLDIRSPEFEKIQNEIEKLSRASDVAGTVLGRGLQARKNYVPVEETISDYVTTEKEVVGVETLTDKQKETVKKEYEDIKEAKRKFDEYIAQKEADFSAKQAKAVFERQKGTTKKTKKTHEDHVEYRKKVVESIKEKLKQARGDTSATIVPYAKELFAIAPDVAKLVKDLVEEGVTKLEDVVRNIHTQLKPLINGVQEKDVHDIIAGVYNEKKKPRSELAAKVFELKRESKYVNKLLELLGGEEPKSEKAKIERNKNIAELKKHIKNISEFEKDVERQKTQKVELAAKEKYDTEKGLSKAEKEIDKADEKATKEMEAAKEKERRKLHREAEVERKKAEREFEKEVRQAERAALKAKVEEARRIERELAFRTPEEKALDRLKTKMTNEIKEIEEQLRSGNFDKEVVVKPKLELDASANELRDELISLRQKRELRLLLQQRQSEGGRERALRYTAEVANIPRTLMTIADFSALLRQNLFFSAGHPLMTSKAIPGMFRSFTSQKVYDRWFADYQESPRYEAKKESKLAIADSLSHDLTQREESFMSSIAEKIPLGVGKIVKGSERSYTMLLNKMRSDMFDFFADSMEARGVTIKNSPKAYKAMAEYINNATGRSDFGETLNRVAPILNSVFFSPRLVASRINMLTYWAQPRFWKTVPKEVRVDYFRNWISLLAVGGTILAIAKLGGADVEDDPRSADFGKIKSGNTRWDIWGGAQPYIRVVAQVVSGQRKSTNSGKIYELNGDDIFGETKAGVVGDFFRNKLAPVPGAAVDLLSRRTVIGDKIVYEWSTDKNKEISIRRYIQDRIIPMTVSGTAEAMKDQGVKALFTVGIPSTFGVGTQTYDKQKPLPPTPTGDSSTQQGKKQNKGRSPQQKQTNR